MFHPPVTRRKCACVTFAHAARRLSTQWPCFDQGLHFFCMTIVVEQPFFDFLYVSSLLRIRSLNVRRRSLVLSMVPHQACSNSADRFSMACGPALASTLKSVDAKDFSAAGSEVKVTGAVCTQPAPSEESQFLFVNGRSLSGADRLLKAVRDFFDRHRLLVNQIPEPDRQASKCTPTSSPAKRRSATRPSPSSFAKLQQDQAMFPAFLLHVQLEPEECDFHLSGQRNTVLFAHPTKVSGRSVCLWSRTRQ